MKLLLISMALLFSIAGHAKLKVYTTTTNLADIVKHVGGNDVEVESLCLGTQDPHFLEAKPSYTFKLSKADLLVSVGAGLEVGWLPLVVRGSRNPRLNIGETGRFVAADHIDTIEKVSGSVTRADGDIHPEGNPHFSLGPSRVIKLSRAIASKLSELEPKKKDVFTKNQNEFEKKMSEMINKWKLVALKKKIISYHKTLSYFYDEFGISNIAVLEPKPGIPPSAAHILKVIKKIKEQKVELIIVENYFDDAVARRIQNEVKGIKVETVPVAVKGNSKIKDLFDLYELLLNKVKQ